VTEPVASLIELNPAASVGKSRAAVLRRSEQTRLIVCE
jgi:hypothetical protein